MSTIAHGWYSVPGVRKEAFTPGHALWENRGLFSVRSGSTFGLELLSRDKSYPIPKTTSLPFLRYVFYIGFVLCTTPCYLMNMVVSGLQKLLFLTCRKYELAQLLQTSPGPSG